MYSSPKLTTFLVSLLVLINYNAFSYTFYVETSEFNDDVYVIENVIVNEESITADKNEIVVEKTKRSPVSNELMPIQNARSDFLSREYEQHCTNLKTKPLGLQNPTSTQW